MMREGTPADWLSWLVASDPRMRKEATLILGGLTPDDDVPLAPLIDALASENDDIVFWATIGLGRSGSRAVAAVNELARIANCHDKFGNRQAAVNALGQISPSSSHAKLAVLGALEDSSPFVRRDALQALIQFTDLSADDMRRIRQMEHDPDETVASWSEITIRNIRLKLQTNGS